LRALERLAMRGGRGVKIHAPPGAMGADVARQAGFAVAALKATPAAVTSAADSRAAAAELVRRKVALLLFAGGDGTARHRRFQEGLWRLFQAPRFTTELATPETIICRCEELTLSEIEADLEPGSNSIGALKRRTRGGMGRCQGRYCGSILTALSAAREGRTLDEAGHWAPRPPITPIPIGQIVDDAGNAGEGRPPAAVI